MKLTAARTACTIVFCSLLLQACVTADAERSADGASTPPNIVILFADDLGYGDLSSYGHPTIRTPHLDGMAQEGMRMTSFYTAAPSCTPSRAALLTGRYPVRVGLPHVLMPDVENGLPPEEITLAEALKEEGYRTMAVGKWHLGHARPALMPTANGFDRYFGLLYSNDMIRPWVQTDRPLELYRDTEPVGDPGDQSMLTVRYTEEAVDFIREDRSEPFFLYLAYSMPHLPINTADRFRGRSRAGLYGDVIETIDWSAGRVLQALQEEGLDENTIVVFTSDNGPWLNLPDRMLQAGNEPWHAGSPGLLRGAKATTYEGGMRVPGIVRWPGRIPAGQVSAEIATTMDLYPTLLNAAGAEVPRDRPVDGADIMPLLTGSVDASPTRGLYYFQGTELQGVRDGRWKLRVTGEEVELFDLEVDPSERYNVAEAHSGVVARLREEMRRFDEDVRTDRP